MRGVTLYRFIAVALIAVLCLAIPSLAQNGTIDNNGSNTDASTDNSATASSNEHATTPAPSRTNSADGSSDEEHGSTSDESTTSERSNSKDSSSEKPTPTDDGNSSEDPSESFDESYEETGVPGTVSLLTPDYQLVPTPMFGIGEQIVIGWNYSSDTQRPPKKLSICGRFPTGSSASTSSTDLCNWYIAKGIPGTLRNYTWDTVTQGAPGVAFFEDSGYQLYFFDSDYGVNNPTPGAGRIVPSQFWFNMYRSRYGLTNEGVPVGYKPSAAAHMVLHAWTVAAGIALSIVCIMA
ncbi:hypothetical protein GGI11_004097 [Coemansia sp. RSA 2049]|nr:hypothetical protein GGI11_004097 [Coemansia sp. RSA 2049]